MGKIQTSFLNTSKICLLTSSNTFDLDTSLMSRQRVKVWWEVDLEDFMICFNLLLLMSIIRREIVWRQSMIK